MKKNRPNAGTAAAEALLEYLRSPEYRPVGQRQLLHRMHVPAEQLPDFRAAVRRLLTDGRIVRVSRGRLASAPMGGTIRGTLQRHRDGFGFVVPEDGGDDLFVPPRHLGDAVSGDLVEARVTRRDGSGRAQGVLVRTIERRSRELLGVFSRRGRGGSVRPFDPSFGGQIAIRAEHRLEAEEGQVVQVEILRAGGDDGLTGKVVSLLGDLDDPGTDVRVVAHKYGLAMEIPDNVLAAAAELPARIPARAKQGRERFDDPPPLTIDGETAKDFDDAIAVEELPNDGFRLFVHIADVGHFVPPGSALDDEASSRGTSVYFPGTVLPMFPEKLSNDLCSLRPGVDRLVQSAILDLDSNGLLRKVRFADGVIRSAARLTYTQVAQALDGDSRGHGVPQKLVPMLRTADRLRERLEQQRAARGGIDFDLPEPQLLLDVEGAMTGIEITPRNRAHRMIEGFMIAANEAVAGHLEQRKSACMFRVHDAPDPMKLITLAEFAASFGLKLRKDASSNPSEAIRDLMARAEGRPEYRWIGQLALRSMKQALYSLNNIGHFGLASPSYCHFTSPIRRYPDLVVHRLLRDLRNGRGLAAAEAGAELDSIAQNSSERERNAEAAERELLAWKKVAYIEGREGEEFDGAVTGVAAFGLFVQLEENLVEGLIKVDLLGGGRYAFDEARMLLRPRSAGRAFRLGDKLRVRIDRVDRILRRVDFSLAGRPAPTGGVEKRSGDRPGSARRKKRTPTAKRGATSKRRPRRRR